MARLWIDGHEFAAKDGVSLLTAIRDAGFDIPAACSDPRLKPSGSCRLCLVRLENQPKLVSSCALSVVDGMRASVMSDELEAYRFESLRALARDYPKDLVEALPEKPLHRWFVRYGVDCAEGDFARFVDDTNPYFRFDPAGCIDCFKCEQVCSELQGSFVWHFVNRGDRLRVLPNSDTTLIESSCKSCGACSDVCPSGALVDKARLTVANPIESWTKTTCPYCGVGCELEVGVSDRRIVQVKPVKESPVSKGHLCVKGRYAHAFVHAPDRVTEPMIRVDGDWKTVSWDEALSFVVQKFSAARDQFGPHSIGVLGSARGTNEENYLAQKFARAVIGTNNVDCCARVCHAPSAAGMKMTLGTGAATSCFDDIEIAKTILIVGANPSENHPIVGERIKQAVLNGAKLIVIDPRRIELAEIADVHLMIRPGMNVPVLNTLANIVISGCYSDRAFIESRTADFEAYAEFVKEWTPERCAELAHVGAEDLVAAAELFGKHKPAIAFHGLGVTEHTQGTEGVMAIVNLALVTGNIGKPGAGVNPLRGQNNVQGSAHMGCDPNSLTGGVDLLQNRERFESVWNLPISKEPGLNMIKMMDRAKNGEIKALWVIGYDVYMSNPYASESDKSFANIDCVIVQDLFMNETAKRFGHVFLPCCSSFERDGTFMNSERRIQRVRKAMEPIGNSRSDWEIICDVASRMGYGSSFHFSSPEEIWEEIRKVWPAGAGISYSRIEEHGLQWPCFTEDDPGAARLHGLTFAIGDRAKFRKIEYRPTPEEVSDEYPLMLVTGRHLYHFNAGTMTERTLNAEIRPTDRLDCTLEDASRLGFSDGCSVRVVSKYGSVVVPLHICDTVSVGEVFATFHTAELMVNQVTGPHRDKFVGAPEYKVTAVRLEAVGG